MPSSFCPLPPSSPKKTHATMHARHHAWPSIYGVACASCPWRRTTVGPAGSRTVPPHRRCLSATVCRTVACTHPGRSRGNSYACNGAQCWRGLSPVCGDADDAALGPGACCCVMVMMRLGRQGDARRKGAASNELHVCRCFPAARIIRQSIGQPPTAPWV